MSDLVSEIAALEARFQHIADLHPWVTLAMPPWGRLGSPTIGAIFTPSPPPPEPPGKILDGSGQPVPPTKPSLLEKAEYAKSCGSIRFSDEHGHDRDAPIEEYVEFIRNLESPDRMLELNGPFPWVMPPKDPQRRRITEHAGALTWKADGLLLQVLDGPNQILGDVPEQIREWNKKCPLLGWICWLRHSVPFTGPVGRIENYPQVAATALIELRDVVGSKTESLKPAAAVAVKRPTKADVANGTPAGDEAKSETGKSANEGAGTIDHQAALQMLLRVFTNGVMDEKIDRAASVLQDTTLTADEKLTKIDGMIPFPPTVSAATLGRLVGVTKQAVMKEAWWTNNRKGEKENAIGRRRAKHCERSEQQEPDNGTR